MHTHPVRPITPPRAGERGMALVTTMFFTMALLMMDMGMLSYTASTGAVRTPTTLAQAATGLLQRTGPVLLTNAVLLGFCWAIGAVWAYGLWLTAYMTTFSVFVRLRAMAEHGGIQIIA